MAAALHLHSMPAVQEALAEANFPTSSGTLKQPHGLDQWFSIWGSNDPFPGAAYQIFILLFIKVANLVMK